VFIVFCLRTSLPAVLRTAECFLFCLGAWVGVSSGIAAGKQPPGMSRPTVSSISGPGSITCGADGFSIGRGKSIAIALEQIRCDGPTWVSNRRGRGAGSCRSGWIAPWWEALVFAFVRLRAAVIAILRAARRFFLSAWVDA